MYNKAKSLADTVFDLVVRVEALESKVLKKK